MNAGHLIEATGWTLIHSIWQGLIVALGLAAGLRVSRSASARYLASVSAMAVLPGSALATFFLLLPNDTSKQTTQNSAPSTTRMESVSIPGSGPSKTSPAGESVLSLDVLPLVDQPGMSPPRASAATSAAISWENRVVILWLCGVAFFGLRFFLDWRATLSLQKLARPLDLDSEWKERFVHLSGCMGVSRPVTLLTSAAIRVPAAFGVLRPVVIVPLAMLSYLPPAQIDAILLHELAHIRRHDFLVNLLQSIAETLFFFHPEVWWISRKIREERENCCDDLAASASGDVGTYANALAALEKSRGEDGLALGMAADGGTQRSGDLVSRIRRLLRSDRKSSSSSPSGWPLVAVGLLALVAAFFAFVMITNAAATDQKDANWMSLQTSTFGDREREIVCIYRDNSIEAVIVIELPEKWATHDSSAGVRVEKVGKEVKPRRAFGEYRWDDVHLKIGFDSKNPQQLTLNDQVVLLRNGRVVFWRLDEKWADQSKVLAEDLPMPDRPSTALGQLLTKLRDRIIAEFSPAEDANQVIAPIQDADPADKAQPAPVKDRVQTWVDAVFQLDDEAKKNAAINEIRDAVASGDHAKIKQGLEAFTRLGEVQFDKASFHDLLVPLLKSSDAKTRTLASGALVMSGLKKGDFNRLLALADDPDQSVRQAVAYQIVFAAERDLTGKAGDAILKLLQEDDQKFRKAVIRSLWGAKLSPGMETRIIELSRSEIHSESYDALYYALSTQANKSEASVKRLIEFLSHQDTLNVAGRAAWGLGQGVAKKQQSLVADAALKIMGARKQGSYLFNQSLSRLEQHAGVDQRKAIEAFLAKPGIDDDLRKRLEKIIEGIPAQAKAAIVEKKKQTPVVVDGGYKNAWSARGKVVDADGKPLPEVEISVHSGMGSLRRTGFAKTGHDGRYEVTFSRGILMSVDSPNLQVAQITAHLPGYVERNLSRHGNGAMAIRDVPEEDLKSWKINNETDLVLPGKPRQLDFVMVPANRIEGTLVASGAFSGASPKVARKMDSNLPRGPYADLDDSPLAGWRVWITGDELPPGSSVWDEATTDKNGAFVFENVPIGFEWHFQTDTNFPGNREPISRKFTLAASGSDSPVVVKLELKSDQKEVRLKFPGKDEPPENATAEPDHNVTLEGQVDDAKTGTIEILNDHEADYRTQAPSRVTFESDETAEILENKTVQFSLPGPAWSEASIHYQFDESVLVERILLWVLPDGRLPFRRLGRNGQGKLILFDLKPELRSLKTGKRIKGRSVEFSLCKNPFCPDDESLENLIDYQSDTGWEVPLKENGVGRSPVELEFFFRSPVLVTPGEELVLTLDSGGDGKNLDTPALIKIAMSGPKVNSMVRSGPKGPQRRAVPKSYLDKFQAQKWPDQKLAALPFGPPDENGLRVARYFQPKQKIYEMGSRVAGRIVFHNSGTEPVTFTTEDWHQRDAWHCRNAAGDEVRPEIAERMGFRAYPTFRLEPGEVGEVSAQGTAIGRVPYDDEPGPVYVTSRLDLKPGDALTCWWDVTLHLNGKDDEETLRSGEISFEVIDRPADFPVDLGISRGLGKYHLSKGIKLQCSRGSRTTATIEWEDGRRHIAALAHRAQTDPIEMIAWWRGGTSFWIVDTEQLRKIDFADPADVKETSWPWKDAPEDFGDAPELVREAIARQRKAAGPISYKGRSIKEWDHMMKTGHIRSENREPLALLGFGTDEVPVPNEAIPMLLALVESGQAATRCRCLGRLRKLENPDDKVLDTVIGVLADPDAGGVAGRAGHVLGYFPERADYTVPRVLALMEKHDGAVQEAAIRALGMIGPPAKDAIPALEALRAGSDEDLLKVITKSIEEIEGDRRPGDEPPAPDESIDLL